MKKNRIRYSSFLATIKDVKISPDGEMWIILMFQNKRVLNEEGRKLSMIKGVTPLWEVKL